MAKYGIYAKDILTVIWHKHNIMLITRTQEKELLKKFGERIRKLRKEKGLSQEDLANEIEMDLTSINEIEQGHRSPKLLTIYKISRALRVSTNQLFPF